jgi:hypothetical protein
MASAKQKQTTKYAVTLAVEGSKLETVAKKIKDAVGDVKVLSVEKVAIPGSGEWATEWVKHVKYMNPVLVNTDGRVIQRFEEYDDNNNLIEDKYAYYFTRDAYDKQIANADGKYHIESLEEAKSLVREPMTQAEILDAADAVAAHVVRYGAGDREESDDIKNAAESYLIGRGKEMPEEYDEEEEGNRRTPEYIVTLRIKASTLPAIEKKARAAFGDKLKSVKKVGRGFSRAAELGQAGELVEQAKEIVGELRSSMEEWRDNMPDSLQGGEKYCEVEECASNLESLEDGLNNINFEVEFPGMY